jgi:hypothetical protein
MDKPNIKTTTMKPAVAVAEVEEAVTTVTNPVPQGRRRLAAPVEVHSGGNGTSVEPALRKSRKPRGPNKPKKSSDLLGDATTRSLHYVLGLAAREGLTVDELAGHTEAALTAIELLKGPGVLPIAK